MSRLSREDWASAALDALSAGGLAAVAVEPLAVRLGTTKGSFYWHFGGRDELVEAALRLWRQAGTTSIIEGLEAGGAPATQRLRQLFTQVFAPEARTDADLALLADAGHPLVAAALADVTEQRLAYLTALFRELGFPPARARRRALLAYSAYLGQLQLMRSAPGLLPKPGPARTAYADDILATLLAEGPVRPPSG
ncbi:TetR/AcrR family transcriptional regulator [Actinoplanes sp. NPDC026623]|uniref:TetR/AcrR family transcriptional regulator n=1 Tax=Actinoplanes sp. NPDC026623 TaxID=3155610 RepID=UPI0033E07313